MSRITTEPTLTINEAYAIHHNWFFGGHVPEALHTLALKVIDASLPEPIPQAPMDWHKNDDAQGYEDEMVWWQVEQQRAEDDWRDYLQGRA